jgi:protein ImuA
MPTPDRQQRLAALRDAIADIERKPALAETRARLIGQGDDFPTLGGGLLQEVFTDSVRNGGASLAFALGQAKTLLQAQRSAVLYVQLASDAQFFGLPYGPGLVSFGFDPAQLLIVRTAEMAELLWVAEEALACQAIAGIVADVGGEPGPLDFTASRRLSLRAAENGASLFLLRYGSGRDASAAHLRWHVAPHAASRRRHDSRAPGQARWRIRLEKGVTDRQSAEWLLEWGENGFAAISTSSDANQRVYAGAAFSGAVSPLLADRLSQTA